MVEIKKKIPFHCTSMTSHASIANFVLTLIWFGIVSMNVGPQVGNFTRLHSQ